MPNCSDKVSIGRGHPYDCLKTIKMLLCVENNLINVMVKRYNYSTISVFRIEKSFESLDVL